MSKWLGRPWQFFDTLFVKQGNGGEQWRFCPFFLNIGENVSVACKIGDVMFSNSKKDNLKFCHKSLISLNMLWFGKWNFYGGWHTFEELLTDGGIALVWSSPISVKVFKCPTFLGSICCFSARVVFLTPYFQERLRRRSQSGVKKSPPNAYLIWVWWPMVNKMMNTRHV